MVGENKSGTKEKEANHHRRQRRIDQIDNEGDGEIERGPAGAEEDGGEIDKNRAIDKEKGRGEHQSEDAAPTITGIH